MSETLLDLFRRAPGNTAGPLGFLLNENAPLVDFLRRRFTPATRPAESPVTEPMAPAVSENQPSPFQQAQLDAARRRAAERPATPAAPAEETPETFEAMRQFQAGLRNQQMQGSGQLSVLDMLRKRMTRDMEGEALQRASEFGAGMLASGSPNFFTMLGAGARAAREGDVSRMEQLRRLADLERQDAAQRAEEARRVEELRIREAAQAAEAPLRAAQTEQALALAAEIRAGRGRGTLTAANLLRARTIAANEARLRFPDPARDDPNRDAKVAEIGRLREDYIVQILPRIIESLPGAPATTGGAPAAPVAPAAPAAPAAVIDLTARPTAR